MEVATVESVLVKSVLVRSGNGDGRDEKAGTVPGAAMNAASGIDVGTVIGATEAVNGPLLHAALPIFTLFLLKIGGHESYLESRLVAPKSGS